MAIDLRQLNHTPAGSEKPSPKSGSSLQELLSRDISLSGNRFGDRQKERFYNELHTLLTSGIDIRTALELLENEAEKKDEQKLFAQIRQAVISGSTLPDAVCATGRFSDYEFFSLRIGEESGRMSTVLHDLADYYTKKIRQSRRVRSALTYPSVVVSVAIGAVWFMLHFVVPMFADMLRRFNTELPALTKGIIALSNSIGHYGPWILLALLGAGIFIYTQRKQLWYRRISASVLLRLPYIGSIARKVYLERFAHAMHLLLTAKTPLVNALELVQKMTGFYPLEHALEQVRHDVMRGMPLHESLGKFPVFTKRFISLLRVAEEVNQLEQMFARLSKQYTEEIEHDTGVLGSVIEPVMIIFLGLAVALILVAMYMPMFQLSSSFQ
ncbi:MAG: type II secretion system F family protein [Bacteroidetes bacterium]|nr:type II secretion system F family protein [Bacteroidota bacterium]